METQLKMDYPSMQWKCFKWKKCKKKGMKKQKSSFFLFYQFLFFIYKN